MPLTLKIGSTATTDIHDSADQDWADEDDDDVQPPLSGRMHVGGGNDSDESHTASPTPAAKTGRLLRTEKTVMLDAD